MNKNEKSPTFSAKKLSFIALCSAILCVISPFSIPIFAVPISLSTFAVYLTGAILGGKYAPISVSVYILIGIIGVPVFSGFNGGINVLVGPTGGFLIGYIACSFIVGAFCNSQCNKKSVYFISMLIGTFFIYLFGVVWFIIISKADFITAISVCVLPFIVFDFVKIAAAVFIAAAIKPKIFQS